ncbi:MAG: hypothetical protein ACOY0T_20460 [Myxococcota bacterium]
MARLEHSGKRSYWHLLSSTRKPSEYAIRSSRLDYYRPMRFEVDAPLVGWFEQYAAERTLSEVDWERFDDPSGFTYATYVARRRDDEMFVQRLLDAEAPLAGPASAELALLWQRALAPVRFPFHALQMASAYVAHLAPASKISICAMFQAADELRCIQRVAYRLAQLEPHCSLGLATSGKNAWLEDSAWQGLRALTEKLLVTYDFSEAFFALTRMVAPACARLLLLELGGELRLAGDARSADLLAALYEDSRWHAAWSQRLLHLIVESSPANGEHLRGLVEQWQPLIFQAIAPLTELLKISREQSTALERSLRDFWEF